MTQKKCKTEKISYFIFVSINLLLLLTNKLNYVWHGHELVLPIQKKCNLRRRQCRETDYANAITIRNINIQSTSRIY